MYFNFNTRPYVVINNKDSRSIAGLLICTLPPISKPPKRTIIETIDGRDGDIVSVLGYDAYDKSFEIGLTKEYNIDDVIAFFDSEGKIVFGNEPDKYYKFATYSQIDFERLLRFKKADIELHVQPFKYAEAEEERIITANGNETVISCRNDGNIYSRPIISIKGIGDVKLTINGYNLSIELPTDKQTTIIFDSAEMEAKDISGKLLNRLVTGSYDMIRLEPGDNEIKVKGNVSEVKISMISRWI